MEGKRRGKCELKGKESVVKDGECSNNFLFNVRIWFVARFACGFGFAVIRIVVRV